MPVVRNVGRNSEPRKLLGVKISNRVIKELKQYAKYVGYPINYCAEKLLEHALRFDHEFQANKKQGRRIRIDPVAAEKAWNAFLSMGRNAVEGKVDDLSVHHDRYLYNIKSKR